MSENKECDSDFINAGMALERAAKTARRRAHQAGVIVMENSRIKKTNRREKRVEDGTPNLCVITPKILVLKVVLSQKLIG